MIHEKRPFHAEQFMLAINDRWSMSNINGDQIILDRLQAFDAVNLAHSSAFVTSAMAE